MPPSSGIDLRAVQFWFQENDKGISNANIDWLSKIFSEGNKELARLWRVKLLVAKKKSSQKRKLKTNKEVIKTSAIGGTGEISVTPGTNLPTDIINKKNNSSFGVPQTKTSVSLFPLQRKSRQSKSAIYNTRTIAELSENAFHSQTFCLFHA